MQSPMNNLVVDRCLSRIKEALKHKQLTYTDVASILDVSENTVKRMLNHADIGLDRLLTLADICDLDIGELIGQAKSEYNPHHFFSERQDLAFEQKPHLMSYFTQLFYQHKSPQQIAEENQLSELTTYRYLRALENIELIKLEPENKFSFLVKAPLGFAANSRVLRKIIAGHIEQTVDKVMSPQREEGYFAMVKPLRMPQELFAKMWNELERTVEKYAEVAEIAYSRQDDLASSQITLVGHPMNSEGFEHAKIVSLD